MERVSLTVDRYVMEAVVSLTTGDQRITIDKTLLGPGPLPDRSSPDLLELRMRVKLEDFLNANPATPQAAFTQAEEAEVRCWAQEIFPSIAEEVRRDFEGEVNQLAERHLGRHGWLVLQTSVRLASLEMDTVLLVAGGLAAYGGIREGARLAYLDVVERAVPFAHRVGQKLFRAKMFPGQAQAGMEDAGATEATPKPGQAEEGSKPSFEDAALGILKDLQQRSAQQEQKLAELRARVGALTAKLENSDQDEARRDRDGGPKRSTKPSP